MRDRDRELFLLLLAGDCQISFIRAQWQLSVVQVLEQRPLGPGILRCSCCMTSDGPISCRMHTYMDGDHMHGHFRSSCP